MSDKITVIRPGVIDAAQRARELSKALDDLGIPVGGEFIVMRPEYQLGLMDFDSSPLPETVPGVRDLLPEVPDPTRAQRGAARTTDRATSKKAAEFVAPRAGTQRHEILMALLRNPMGMTNSELVEATGIPYRSLTPRVGQLKNEGYIAFTGKERKSDMGADQDVVVASPKAVEWSRTIEDAS